LPASRNNASDLFRSQLSQILNPKHSLIRLLAKMNWATLEAQIDTQYVGEAGQPPLPTRLLVGLHYLNTPSMNATSAWSSAG